MQKKILLTSVFLGMIGTALCAAQAPIPPGPWKDNCLMKSMIFTASCQNDHGDYHDTSIDILRLHNAPLSNCNGKLTAGSSCKN